MAQVTQRALDLIDGRVCPPEILAQLKAKKCPACGKECTPRKGGFSKVGWFMGCPDYPHCPGKAPSMSAAQRQASTKKLSKCYRFINDMGSIEEAKKWMELACTVIKAQKDSPLSSNL